MTVQLYILYNLPVFFFPLHYSTSYFSSYSEETNADDDCDERWYKKTSDACASTGAATHRVFFLRFRDKRDGIRGVSCCERNQLQRLERRGARRLYTDARMLACTNSTVTDIVYRICTDTCPFTRS